MSEDYYSIEVSLKSNHSYNGRRELKKLCGKIGLNHKTSPKVYEAAAEISKHAVCEKARVVRHCVMADFVNGNRDL